ncbi:hypothetical protein AB0K18_09575 [Nonomuraea sp. NPDC049421]|uniref:hypothetical protein n=1 Tax=Nonomuraea sp. NPDC049421 TaxID=3155275 RepID=UPI00342955D9
MSFLLSAQLWARKAGKHLYTGLVMLGAGVHAPSLPLLWDGRPEQDVPDRHLSPSERAAWHQLTTALTSDEKS